MVVALTDFDRTVFKPVMYSVVIWPGATLMTAGSEYPVPVNVGPWAKSGTGLMMMVKPARQKNAAHTPVAEQIPPPSLLMLFPRIAGFFLK
jgi:hypothetical protein